MSVTTSRSKFFLGGGAALGTVVFLAILVALQYIILQHPQRWDFTRMGKFTLAPQSKKILASFKEKDIPIEVVAFYEISDMRGRELVRDLLEQYRAAYNDFSYTFVDPDKERALALTYNIDTYPTIVIKAADKDERVSTADEETFTNALLKLLRTEVKKVYFVKGHGELSPESTAGESMSAARQQIEKQNYQTEEIVLLRKDKVPEDASMLIVAGPKTDPTEHELKILKAYLDGGGKLLVLLNPFQTPKFADFLAQYGFLLTDDIVVDKLSRALGGDYLMPVITSYNEFPITKNFGVASMFPETRSVRKAKEPVPNVIVKELALTSPVSWTISEEQLKSGNATFDEKQGFKGPVPVMAVSTYTNLASLNEFTEEAGEAKEGKKGKEAEKAGEEQTNRKIPEDIATKKPTKARIVVFGSSMFASDKFFPQVGNRDLFMNTVSWLAEEEDLISIRAKSSKAEPLTLTSNQSAVIFFVPIILIPAIWFAAGVAVFYYRRRTATSGAV